MRFKKPRGVLLGIGFGAFVIAAVLFFLVPIICKEGFAYNGLSALLAGLTALVSFNFVNVLYTALLILFVIAVAALIIFAITLIQKKQKVHLITWFFTLVCIFGSFVFVSSYFLADVEFNGVVGKLLDSMLKVDGQVLGKILSSLALAFAILSNVVLVVHMFVCMVSLMVSDQIKNFEDKLAAEKEQEFDAKVAAAVAANPVYVEKEVPQEVTAEKLIQEASEEERKEKELKLFKECVDSGYFTEYEEIEFPDAIEGADEELVCEASVVEEKSSFIRKSSVHVGFTHD